MSAYCMQTGCYYEHPHSHYSSTTITFDASCVDPTKTAENFRAELTQARARIAEANRRLMSMFGWLNFPPRGLCICHEILEADHRNVGVDAYNGEELVEPPEHCYECDAFNALQRALSLPEREQSGPVEAKLPEREDAPTFACDTQEPEPHPTACPNCELSKAQCDLWMANGVGPACCPACSHSDARPTQDKEGQE